MSTKMILLFLVPLASALSIGKNMKPAGLRDHVINFHDKKCVHLLVSRYAMGQGSVENLVKARFEQLRSVTFQSLANQTSQQFFWVLVTDPDLLPNVLDKTQKLLAPFKNFRLVQSKKGVYRTKLDMEDMANAFGADRKEFEDVLQDSQCMFTTAIDTDDALRVDFIEKSHGWLKHKIPTPGSEKNFRWLCAGMANEFFPDEGFKHGAFAQNVSVRRGCHISGMSVAQPMINGKVEDCTSKCDGNHEKMAVDLGAERPMDKDGVPPVLRMRSTTSVGGHLAQDRMNADRDIPDHMLRQYGMSGEKIEHLNKYMLESNAKIQYEIVTDRRAQGCASSYTGSCGRRRDPSARMGDDQPGGKVKTRGACGVIMSGSADDNYVAHTLRNAQRIASLKVSKGWCKGDPDLDHFPVIYFHDRPNQSLLLEQGLKGEAPLFELFYHGTAEAPLMKDFAPLPYIKGDRTTYFKWLRPQIWMNSPFDITLAMDGDAIPCGERLTESFQAFTAADVDLAGPKHQGGLNTVFTMFNTVNVRPLFERWAQHMQELFRVCDAMKHDQPSFESAIVEMTGQVKTMYFDPNNVCRNRQLNGCASPSCWVDHRNTKAGIADMDAGEKAMDEDGHGRRIKGSSGGSWKDPHHDQQWYCENH